MKLAKQLIENGNIIVKLQGEFDAQGSAVISPEFDSIVQQELSDSITLDLKKVDYLDTTGIGTIVYLFKRLKAKQQQLSITGVHGQPKDLIELLRIPNAMPVECMSEAIH